MAIRMNVLKGAQVLVLNEVEMSVERQYWKKKKCMLKWKCQLKQLLKYFKMEVVIVPVEVCMLNKIEVEILCVENEKLVFMR